MRRIAPISQTDPAWAWGRHWWLECHCYPTPEGLTAAGAATAFAGTAPDSTHYLVKPVDIEDFRKILGS
jgi:hypothetical protein